MYGLKILSHQLTTQIIFILLLEPDLARLAYSTGTKRSKGLFKQSQHRSTLLDNPQMSLTGVSNVIIYLNQKNKLSNIILHCVQTRPTKLGPKTLDDVGPTSWLSLNEV